MISSHDIELVAASGEVNDNYHFDSPMWMARSSLTTRSSQGQP